MTAKKSPASKPKRSAAKSKPVARTGKAAVAAKRAPVKKAAVKRPASAKKAPAKRAAAKKTPVKKSPVKKAAAKKPPAKRAVKAAAKRAPAKKTAPKKAASSRPAPPVRIAPPSPAFSRRGAGRLGRMAPAPFTEPARRQPTPFKKGDKVVYPHHGAATIVATEKREFDGKRQDFFVLHVAIDSLILRVPAARAVDLGVRPVISKTAAKRVLSVFRTEPEEAGANWSRWYKLLTEKINSGDIFQVAEVVRDLTFAQQTKGISPALKRMLSKARMILASELRFALNLSEEEAMKRLDKSLPRVDDAEEE